ncbi:hypothetical protein V499_01309 [Pseudogymnoascus sp. VKM F-103]|nr:hypothetical protein V499_01309 [Pseudogymnoascus sp. VKM F-103]
MPSHQRHQLSTGEKVKLYLSLGCLVLQCLITFLIKLIPRLFVGWSPSSIFAVAYMRSVAWISFKQSRAIALPTGQRIMAFCQSAGLACRSVNINNGDNGPQATLHYIHVSDCPKARLLLYFHGGAYVHPISTKGQLPFGLECARAAGASDLVCLEYTLAPELKYPGQLVQAVDALDYILSTHHPSQIILGGDSAGGHLVLSLLAHIQRPNPSVKTLSGFGISGRNILGAYVISPWVSMKYNSKSFKTNASRDFIRAKAMVAYTEMWNPNCSEVCGELLTGGVEFWRNVPVDNLLITAGGWECFLVDILVMASHLQAKEFGTGAAVELSVGEKEVHVQCALDKAVGAPHRQGTHNILSWLIRIAGVEVTKPEGV